MTEVKPTWRMIPDYGHGDFIIQRKRKFLFIKWWSFYMRISDVVVGQKIIKLYNRIRPSGKWIKCDNQ